MTTPPVAATRRRIWPWAIAAAVVAAVVAITFGSFANRDAAPASEATSASPAKTAASTRPSLSVALVQPKREEWPRTIAAQGNIAAWQEAAVGAEITGFRITEVLVNVGDRVRKGQTLARVNADTVEAELNQAKAAVAEAQAVLEEARGNAARARELLAKGFFSAQAAAQAVTAEQTAAARLAAARARLRADELRLAQTSVVAPDEGTISARTVTVGSLTQPGQELFRLIRGNRLEWRAEVTANELAKIAPGIKATVHLPGGGEVTGTVRTVAPTVDPQTRNAIVYVDLPTTADSPARAGMFARGEFDLGRAPALTLPQTAVIQREGFAYAFKVGADNRASEVKIGVGRRVGDRLEVTQGLDDGTQVVASGAGFLADGDLVKVVPATTAQR